MTYQLVTFSLLCSRASLLQGWRLRVLWAPFYLAGFGPGRRRRVVPVGGHLALLATPLVARLPSAAHRCVTGCSTVTTQAMFNIWIVYFWPRRASVGRIEARHNRSISKSKRGNNLHRWTLKHQRQTWSSFFPTDFHRTSCCIDNKSKVHIPRLTLIS